MRHRDFFESLEICINSNRKALFLYGEKDQILIEEFKQKCDEYNKKGRTQYSLVVIPGGNHSFTGIGTEKEAIEKTIDWLQS